jgi:serine protease Do
MSSRLANLLRWAACGVFLLSACGASPVGTTALLPESTRVTLQQDITASRTNALVLAARRVSPSVVSVVVTQTRIVTVAPFGGFGFDDFFRDFFPHHSYREEVRSMGSGVIVSEDGLVVTNAHVVYNATEIKVTLPDNRGFPAEIVAVDNSLDLALLRISGTNLPVAPLGTSSDLLIGEWAVAIGNPFGFLIEDAQPTVTVGVISAVGRDVRPSRSDLVLSNMIQTDAAINPGNSGGPLVNAAGEVIGINTFILSHSGGSEGIGFARPIDDVKQFINEALGRASARTAENFTTGLGATVADINRSLRLRYQLPYDRGVVVVGVNRGTIAAAMGLQTGDVILLSRGKAVRSAATFARQHERPTGLIDLVVDRRGNQIRLVYRVK